MKQINEIYLSRMNNGAHFTFVTNILNRAKENTAIQEKATEYYNAFSKAVTAEDEALAISRKSPFTDDIAKADDERDMLYTAYKNAVKGFTTVASSDKAAAAKTLMQNIKDYKISVRDQMDKKTGLLINFISDLETKYKDQVTTLGLTALVTSLKDANERLRSYTLQRTEERMDFVLGALQIARTASDTAYADLVRMVNSLAMVNGDTDYADFIDYVNTEVIQYKRAVLKEGPSATKDEIDDSENGGNGSGGNDKPSGGGTDKPGTGGTDKPGTGGGGDDSGELE